VLTDVESEIIRDLQIQDSMTVSEQDLLKVADTCELILKCVKEYHLGNRGGLEIAKRGLNFMDEFMKLCRHREARKWYNKFLQEITKEMQ
jgi:abortive infection bacteriophage resistance protein